MSQFGSPVGIACAVGLAVCPSAATAQDWRAEVGFDRLRLERPDLPDGRTVPVLHVEWRSGNAFLPDARDGEFRGKRLEAVGGGGAEVSSHATSVGKLFYGAGSSLAPGIQAVRIQSAQGFLFEDAEGLRGGGTEPPAEQTARVMNSSWVFNPEDEAEAVELLRRYDFAVERDNMLAVACTRAGDDPILDALLPSSYNGIICGTSNGRNPRGQTEKDGAGRNKPEIVVPMKEPSGAGPVLAAAGALLLDAAHTDPALDEAANAPVLKAILLAGATKAEFPDWEQKPREPLDRVYGAGELNIWNSFRLLEAGRFGPGKASVVGGQGWDWNHPDSGSNLYFIEVAEGGPGRVLSVVLCWNRTVVDGLPGEGVWGEPRAILTPMSLRLYQCKGFSVGPLVNESASEVDNLQHLFARLDPGRYVIEVAAERDTTRYGLAWQLREGE